MTKDGYLRVSDDKKIITYVVVSDNNTEETRFILVKFIFSLLGKHSKKCTFYTMRFGCSFAVANTIKPQIL